MPATALAATATDSALVAADACPPSWPALRGGPLSEAYDGNPSVVVGGDLSVGGTAAGAEGVVVVRGNVSVDRDPAGSYRLGTTLTGSQVTPHPGSDMLVVGGDLTGLPQALIDVGQGLEGDVAVAGAISAGTAFELHGGRADALVPGATAPYDALVDGITARSAAYAAASVTGSVQVSETAITLSGDSTADPQVFELDGALLGAHEREGRTLQLVGVPAGAAVVVNLTGPVAEIDVDALLAPDGTLVDPASDPYFADLATRLLWNVPTATRTDIDGRGQLPGSVVVGDPSGTTTLRGAGTNGRVQVAGNLVHAGGELHSYPFLRDPALGCGPDLAHRGTLTVEVRVKDPAGVVDPDRVYEGTVACLLGGDDVTPGDGTWRTRAGADPKVLAEDVPVGAECLVEERLDERPAKGWDWAKPDIAPRRVTIAKRDPRGFAITNSVEAVRTPTLTDPDPTTDPTPTPDPVEPPDPVTDEPDTPVAPEPTPTVEDREPPSLPAEPEPGLDEVVPTAPPVSGPWEPPAPDDGTDVLADPPAPPRGPGSLTTTAPYTLAGATVWAPLLLLSLGLLVLVQVPRWRWRLLRRLR